jgi:hypothetical protein
MLLAFLVLLPRPFEFAVSAEALLERSRDFEYEALERALAIEVDRKVHDQLETLKFYWRLVGTAMGLALVSILPWILLLSKGA